MKIVDIIDSVYSKLAEQKTSGAHLEKIKSIIVGDYSEPSAPADLPALCLKINSITRGKAQTNKNSTTIISFEFALVCNNLQNKLNSFYKKSGEIGIYYEAENVLKALDFQNLDFEDEVKNGVPRNITFEYGVNTSIARFNMDFESNNFIYGG